MRIRHLLTLAWTLAIPGLALAEQIQRPPLQQVPEPETLALLAIGAAAIFIARRCKKK